MMFTPDELEELRRADAEIDENFCLTNEEIQASRKRDRESVVDRKDNHGKKIAAQKAAYYEANKEKIAAQQAAYREANKEKIAAQQAAYREANKEKIADYQAAWKKENREKWNAYQREYRNKRKAASRSASPKSGS